VQNATQNAGKRFRAPKIVTFGRWYRFSSGGRVIALYAEWAASQQPVLSLLHLLSLSLALSTHVCTCLHYTFTTSSFLSLSRSLPERRKNEAETEKGDGMDDGNRGEGGVGTGREGLGIASCIGEHKRSRNNTIGKRARHRPTRARTFRAPTRVALPRVVRAGIRKKKKKARTCARSLSRRNARTRAV